jgi:DNA ligase-1
MSRGNVEYTALVHIKQVLEQTLPKNYILDGEVYIHGTGFQTLTSLTKKLREGTETLEYHLYDVALRDDPNANFATRYGKLEAWQRSFTVACLKLVETTVHAAQDVLKIASIESKWVEKGYEGAIIRPKAGKYEYGFRSNTLLKVKTFSDAEFEVVNVIEGKGKFEGKACFICKNDLTDITFE